MNTIELRIGNILIDSQGRTCRVTEINELEFKAWPINNGPVTTSPHSPIPLTEEWLKRLGFENSEEAPNYFYHKEFDRIYVKFLIYNFIYGNKLGDIVPVDYVHSLQNLFFAFHKKELLIYK